MVPKALRRMLTKGGLQDPTLATETILRQRDCTAKPKPSAKEADASECPFCMEPYSEAAPGLRVPRILTACGHSACHGCYAQMLRPINARGNAKPLPCPVCREPLAKVHNATLSGGRVAIGFRCPLCRYTTGHRWREPARYGFSLKEG